MVIYRVRTAAGYREYGGDDRVRREAAAKMATTPTAIAPSVAAMGVKRRAVLSELSTTRSEIEDCCRERHVKLMGLICSRT